MIKKRSEMPVEGHDSWCQGRGHADSALMLTRKESLGKFASVSEITLEPGGLIGDHPHTTDADLYIVTQGTARVNDNGTFKVIEAGELSFTPEGEHHSIENIGEGVLKFLAVMV